MSEDRYRQLQDAITKARENLGRATIFRTDSGRPVPPPVADYGLAAAVLAHLDTLQAILNWHVVAVDGNCGNCCHYRWPCPDVLTVETALREMGAIND